MSSSSEHGCHRWGKGGDAFVLFLLLGVTATLPLFPKQPTHALAFLLSVAAVLRILKEWQKWHCEFSWIEATLLLLLFSALASTILGFAPLQSSWHGVNEAILAWGTYSLIYREAAKSRRWQWVADAAILAPVIGATMALSRHVIEGVPLELPGVKGTIRSSLYVSIALFLAFGYAVVGKGWRRVLGAGAFIFLLIFLLMLASRAVIVLTLFLLAGGALALFRRKAVFVLVLLGWVVAIGVALQPESVRQRFSIKAEELCLLVTAGKVSENDRFRLAIWQTAWSWVKKGEAMWFGIGPRQFYRLTHYANAEGISLPASFKDATMTHAHNLLLTRYVEYGLVGLLVLLLFFIQWLLLLWQQRGMREHNPFWWGAMGGLAVPFLAGQVGPAWAYEYAWLSVLMLALFTASMRNNRAILGISFPQG